MGHFDHFSAALAACGVLGIAWAMLGRRLGIRVLRRSERPASPSSLDERYVGQLVQGLFQWTDGLASDVSLHRQMVDSLKRQLKVAEQQAPHEDPAAMVRLLSRIVQTNDMLQQRLDNAELTLKEQAMEISSYMSEARTDTLTGLPNRRAFDDELSRRMMESQRHDTPVCVTLLDIDHFKRFNDRFGHLAGDAVLAHVAQVLRRSVRESELAARLGGEEFVILSPNATAEEACQAAERARAAVEQSACTYDGQSLRVTVSCGAAQLTPGEDPKQLVNRADQALYASKSAGRNCVHWHDGKECRPSARPAAPLAVTSPASVTPASRERRNEEFKRVCDELRRRLIDVISQQA